MVAFQLLEYQKLWWVCRFDINLGQWPSPHSHHQCTLVAEALVIIPVVTAMAMGGTLRGGRLSEAGGLNRREGELTGSTVDPAVLRSALVYPHSGDRDSFRWRRFPSQLHNHS